MVGRSVLLCACVSLGLLASSPVYAYCRTHTSDSAQSSCPEKCTKLGLPLYWANPNITYAFNERGFPQLDDDTLHSLIDSSFQTWAKVRCDGESPGLNIRALSEPTSLGFGPMSSEPNTNAIVHFDADTWEDMDLPTGAFAITAVWFDQKSGRIMGADMMFNGRMDPYGQCSSSGCRGSDPRTDLQNVATHEFGHFLGLSHSDVEGSTMFCSADASEVEKRSLSDDDTAGLCAIYPPGTFDGSDDPVEDDDVEYVHEGGSCSAAPGPRSGTATGFGLSLLALGALVRRRRRK